MSRTRSEAERLMQAMIEDTFADAAADLEALCRAAAVPPQWLHERVEAGLLAPSLVGAADGAAWLRRVRCMRRVETTFDAGPELAALVADLEDEIHRLRQRLHRIGAG